MSEGKLYFIEYDEMLITFRLMRTDGEKSTYLHLPSGTAIFGTGLVSQEKHVYFHPSFGTFVLDHNSSRLITLKELT